MQGGEGQEPVAAPKPAAGKKRRGGKDKESDQQPLKKGKDVGGRGKNKSKLMTLE